MRFASLVVVPGRCPASIAACLAHPRKGVGVDSGVRCPIPDDCRVQRAAPDLLSGLPARA